MARRYYAEFYDSNDLETDCLEFLALSVFDAAIHAADITQETNAEYCILYYANNDIHIGLISYDREMFCNGVKSYV